MTAPKLLAPQARHTRYLLVSFLLLLPCYWQPRLHAGDLSGLIYNGWLSALLENGRAQGLAAATRFTNVLFDLILRGLFHVFSPEAAQRISVSIAVLTFAWGAFAFVSVVSGQRAWHLMPSIAMLAYGWVFHMGFFDFYLSLGLCFWAMAVAWDGAPRHVAASLPIFLLACLSHALPVVWTFALLAYVGLARPLASKRRALLTANFVLAMVVCYLAVARILAIQGESAPLSGASSALTAAAAFTTPYYAVLIGLAVIWALLFIGQIRASGARQVISGIPFQTCIVAAAIVIALPITLLIPGFYSALGFVGARMSLGVAVCLCALLGAVRPRLFERWALLAVALAFFALVYRDQRALNSLEDQMQDVVAAVSASH